MVVEARRTLPPGTRFGRYEVLAEIAGGGMAMVYLGRALGAAGFQRLVAVKVMHPQYSHDDEFVAMFLDEARLAARIHHPNVVATLDLEHDSDGLYLVMEYVEGDTLLTLLKLSARAGQRVDAGIAIRIVLDMLAGLHAAHELQDEAGVSLNLVHRDISPHNVLVGLDGIARITDFGIARAEERLSTTRNGQVKGKLSYMAPEQTTSEPITRRADLFATGVVLWESLASKRLFNGQSDGEVYRKLIDLPIPRVSSVRPDLPAALDDVCARALARDPAERFATAAEFADALEAAAASMGIASQRAVGALVQQIAGDRIANVKSRVREARASSPDVTGSVSAVRAMRARESSHPSMPPLVVEPLENVPSDTVINRRPGARRAALWVVLLAAIGAAALVFAVQRLRATSTPATSTTPTAATMPASPARTAIAAPEPVTARPIAIAPAAPAPAVESERNPADTRRSRSSTSRSAAGTNAVTAPTAPAPAETAPARPATPGSYNPEWM